MTEYSYEHFYISPYFLKFVDGYQTYYSIMKFELVYAPL